MSKTDSNLLRRFAVALTGAMLHTKIRRTVVVSVAFLFKDSIIPPAYLFGRLFFKDTVVDAGGMESVFAKSGLDWTIVRPPQLTDKPLATFGLRDLARRCRRFHDQDGRKPCLGPQNRRRIQLTLTRKV
jgi:hypothetical protein